MSPLWSGSVRPLPSLVSRVLGSIQNTFCLGNHESRENACFRSDESENFQFASQSNSLFRDEGKLETLLSVINSLQCSLPAVSGPTAWFRKPMYLAVVTG